MRLAATLKAKTSDDGQCPTLSEAACAHIDVRGERAP